MTETLSRTPLILLAGGKSSRAGAPKGMLPFRGKPWVQAQVEAFRAIGGGAVFLVLGYDAQAYEEVSLPDLHKQTNPDPEHGPFTSIREGARAALEQGFAQAFVLPIDVPAAESGVWRALLHALAPGVRICQPVISREGADHGGHPVLLAAEEMRSLLAMSPTHRLDLRIRELGPSELARVRVHDERIAMNLNTPESWARFLQGPAG